MAAMRSSRQFSATSEIRASSRGRLASTPRSALANSTSRLSPSSRRSMNRRPRSGKPGFCSVCTRPGEQSRGLGCVGHGRLGAELRYGALERSAAPVSARPIDVIASFTKEIIRKSSPRGKASTGRKTASGYVGIYCIIVFQ